MNLADVAYVWGHPAFRSIQGERACPGSLLDYVPRAVVVLCKGTRPGMGRGVGCEHMFVTGVTLDEAMAMAAEHLRKLDELLAIVAAELEKQG